MGIFGSDVQLSTDCVAFFFTKKGREERISLKGNQLQGGEEREASRQIKRNDLVTTHTVIWPVNRLSRGDIGRKNAGERSEGEARRLLEYIRSYLYWNDGPQVLMTGQHPHL